MACETFKRQDTNYNRQCRLINNVKERFYMAKLCKYTVEKLIESRAKYLYETDDWKRATQNTRAYVEGYWDCLWEMMYRYHLEVRHFLDDEWRTIDEVQRILTNQNRSWSEVQYTGHFWIGTLEPFSADTTNDTGRIETVGAIGTPVATTA
jgi:hypothetical protein